MDDEPIRTQNIRGWQLADGLVMIKYTSENRAGARTELRSGAAQDPAQGPGIVA
jgi:hypothetical protein